MTLTVSTSMNNMARCIKVPNDTPTAKVPYYLRTHPRMPRCTTLFLANIVTAGPDFLPRQVQRHQIPKVPPQRKSVRIMIGRPIRLSQAPEPHTSYVIGLQATTRQPRSRKALAGVRHPFPSNHLTEPFPQNSLPSSGFSRLPPFPHFT